MTILQVTKSFPIMGVDFSLQEKADSITHNLLMHISRRTNPVEIMKSYVWSENSIFSDYEKNWSEANKRIIKTGRKSKHLMMQSLGTYRMAQFIKERFNFELHPKNFQLLTYSYSKFSDMARLECAMLLSKYTDIKDYEIRFAVIRLLFTYFKVYDIDAMTNEPFWSVSMEDINSVINDILCSEVSTLKPYLELLNVDKITIPQQRKKSTVLLPQSADEVLSVIDDSMTAAEKYAAIMEQWPKIKSERKAREILKQFGLSRKYAKTEKAVNEDKPTTHNDMNIIQDLETQIYTLKKQVSHLLGQVEKLQSENNELRKSQGLPQTDYKQSNETKQTVQQQAIFNKNLIPRTKQSVEFDKPETDYSTMTADEMLNDWLERQEKIAECEKAIEEKKHTESEVKPYTDILIRECNSVEMEKLNRLWNR